MQVAAKCIMSASLSSPVQQHFMPGQGPLPGGLYEIDRDGPLADLKTNGGKTGKYVFEFDRNRGPDDKPHDYSCKKPDCGKKFKTLPDLGTHTREAHKAGEREEPDEDTVVVKSSTCKQCNPPQIFASRGEMMKHKGEVHGASFFKKGFGKAAVEQTA